MQASTSPQAGGSSAPLKRARTTIACEACRKKRAKCDGSKPSCKTCRTNEIPCQYAYMGDRRKPYTKDVVVALEMRIEFLEKELTGLRQREHGASDIDGSDEVAVEGPGPALGSTNPTSADAFQGGLAYNRDGELRFYGPTSSYRAVLSEESNRRNATEPDTPHTGSALAQSLTHAIVSIAPPTPTIPAIPPELSHEFRTQLLGLAFEYCLSQSGLVQERYFYRDMANNPLLRTEYYSPLLLNCVLAIGCRYLDPTKPYPAEICGDTGDPDTRGDCFIKWARFLVDHEWEHPKISTVQALACLALALAGRGLDGISWMYCGLAMRLSESFGLHLGIHRLGSQSNDIMIDEELMGGRRDAFYAAFGTDIMLSMYIGRSTAFLASEIDVPPPPISHELDCDTPRYRSSTFHLSSTLMLLASRTMTTIFTRRTGVSLKTKKAEMSQIHLLLEKWYHQLPPHARASMANASKAPPAHIIQLNLTYHTIMITLHRPFLNRPVANAQLSDNLSFEKCFSSAKHICRLVRLHEGAHHLRFTAPAFKHACFSAGTILAFSSFQDLLSDTKEKDAERRLEAQSELEYLVATLRKVAVTWPTANVSAGVLEAFLPKQGVAEDSLGLETVWHPTTTDPSIYDSLSNVPFPFMFPLWDSTGDLDDFSSVLDNNLGYFPTNSDFFI